MPRSRSMSFESMTRSPIFLMRCKSARLLEQAVDEGGLAMIDVGDDGDIADRTLHGNLGTGKKGVEGTRSPKGTPMWALGGYLRNRLANI